MIRAWMTGHRVQSGVRMFWYFKFWTDEPWPFHSGSWLAFRSTERLPPEVLDRAFRQFDAWCDALPILVRPLEACSLERPPDVRGGA